MKLKRMTTFLISIAAVLGTSFAQSNEASDNKVIKVGVIATTLKGPYEALGKDAVRGVKVALDEVKSKIGDYEIEMHVQGSNVKPASAIKAAKRLINVNQVDVVIGPLGGSEGIAIKDFSKTQPKLTFLNGSSAAQGATLDKPSENFFRFGPDGVQMMAGLGTYAFEEKGYKKVVTIAEDYSWSYSQGLGFLYEFCAAGGEVLHREWVPVGEHKFKEFLSKPSVAKADALLVTLGGTNAIKFLREYKKAGLDIPIIGGSITVDQSILSNESLDTELLLGIVSSRGFTTDNTIANWKKFSKGYQQQEGKFNAPSLFATHYYDATKALIAALGEVDDIEKDLKSGQKELRKNLASLELEGSSGTISLDKNRQAVSPNFVTEVVKDKNGKLYNKMLSKKASVDQTVGLGDEVVIATKTKPGCGMIHKDHLARKNAGSDKIASKK